MRQTEGYLISEHGGPEKLVWSSIPLPELKPDEVKIRVQYVGLNHLDTWVRRGVPGHKFPLPLVPGSDVVGILEEVGELAAHLPLGMPVILNPLTSCDRCSACFSGQHQLCESFGLFGETRHGGCAKYVIAPFRNIHPLPTSYAPEELVSFPLVFLTAWHMLISRAQLRPTETVLIHAGGSGVGSAAIQIAKFWGAKVITTAGSAEKLQKAKSLGADDGVLYHNEDWPKQVKEMTGKRGVDVVFEHVGKATFAQSLRLLAKGGRLVTCGATTGASVEMDLRPIFFKGISILGSTMGNRSELLTILQLIEQKVFRPVIAEILSLKQLPQAHERLEKREVFGKIVLKVEN